MVGDGVVHATSTLTLKNMNFILKFPLSLLSTSQLTKNNYSITFFPYYRIFQELHTRMRIDTSHEK